MHPLFDKGEGQKDNLKDTLKKIIKKFEEFKNSELRIFRAKTPRELNRRIKNITKSIHNLNSQCECIELQLKDLFRKSK